jgi:hypothetical protein
VNWITVAANRPTITAILTCVFVQFRYSQNTDDSLLLGFIYAAYGSSTDVLAAVYASTDVSFSALADTRIHGLFGK